jgi:integrase
LREKLGLDLAKIDWGSFRTWARIEPVRIITQPAFQRLLSVIWEEIQGEDKGDVKRAARWQDAFDAAVLMYFFGLRIGETVRLRIEDMVLRGATPYLRVWRSKRRKSRLIYAYFVPEEVMEYLIGRRRARWLEEERDYRIPFLGGGRDEEACRKALERSLMEAFEKAGLLQGAEGHPVTVHSLRDAFANRLMLRVPLLDLSRAMGHSSPETTIRSYILCGDFLHRERLRRFIEEGRWEAGPLGLSYVALGTLIGLGRTGAIEVVRHFIRETGEAIGPVPRRECPKEEVKVPGRIKSLRPDQLLIPDYSVVQLLAWRLGIR